MLRGTFLPSHTPFEAYLHISYIKLAKYYNVSLDYLTGLMDTPRKLY